MKFYSRKYFYIKQEKDNIMQKKEKKAKQSFVYKAHISSLNFCQEKIPLKEETGNLGKSYFFRI